MGLVTYTIGVMLMTLSAGRLAQLANEGLSKMSRDIKSLDDIPNADEIDDEEEPP